MEKNMVDKTCLITGGTSGVGYATALGLARMGAIVVIVSRNEVSGNNTIKDLKSKSGNSQIDFISADLSESESIHELVGKFKSKYQSLHILSNNAAVLPTKRIVNSRGYEITFATNYLSHFLLSHLLLDTLERSSPSRIITVSGNIGLIKHGKIYFNDIHLEQTFNPLKAALQATFAKVLFSLELAKKLNNSGVTSNTFHPGVVRSQLGRRLPFPINYVMNFGMKLIPSQCKSALYLASNDSINNMNGVFFENGKAREFISKNYTKESSQRLWDLSLNLCGLSKNN